MEQIGDLSLDVEPDGTGYVAVLYDAAGLDVWNSAHCRSEGYAREAGRLVAERVTGGTQR